MRGTPTSQSRSAAIFILLLPALAILFPLFGIVWEAMISPSGLEGQGWETFLRLGNHPDYGRWYAGTLTLSLLNMALTLPFCLITAMALAGSHRETRKSFRRWTHLLQFYPPFLSLVAIFLLLERLGLLNSYTGLLLVYQAAQLPFWSWYLWGHLSAIPATYRETAVMEGARGRDIFLRIHLPLILPGLGVLALGSFSLPWFDFILQSLVLSGENTTLAVGLLFWLGEGSAEGSHLFAAGSITAVLPPLMLYFILQRTIHRDLQIPGGHEF